MTKRTKTITQAITRKQKFLKYQAKYREVNRCKKKFLKESEEKYFELSAERSTFFHVFFTYNFFF